MLGLGRSQQLRERGIQCPGRLQEEDGRRKDSDPTGTLRFVLGTPSGASVLGALPVPSERSSYLCEFLPLSFVFQEASSFLLQYYKNTYCLITRILSILAIGYSILG